MTRKNFVSLAAGFLAFGAFSIPALADEPTKKSKRFKVIEKRCDGCGRCFKACSNTALEVTSKGKPFIHPDKCDGCGECTRFCRRMAIVES